MSATLVFDLENVNRVKRGDSERDIISLFEENGVKKVMYRVKKHTQKYRIDTVGTVTRKAFVNWLQGIQLEKDTFKKGDIIEFGKSKFIVLKNQGIFGKVKCLESGATIDKLYWRGCSEIRCFKIGIHKEIQC